MKTLVVISQFALLAVSACGGSTPPMNAAEAQALEPAEPAEAPVPAAKPAVPNGMLTALENGDRACYVVVMTDNNEVSMEGDFDLCTAATEALIGKRVTWTTQKANVQAASCEGSPDCTESDEVDLVISVSSHIE